MIISTVDRFLFETLAITLLASGPDKENLVSIISKITKCLEKAESVVREPDYVTVKQTRELDENIDVLFKKTFVGYDKAWETMNARLKFSGIISAIWNKCHNSLWKLRIAAWNNNNAPSKQIVLQSLAPGVQEFDGGALTSLDQSVIMRLRNMTTTKSDQPPVESMDIETSSDPEQVVNLKEQIALKDRTLELLNNRYETLNRECADVKLKYGELEVYTSQINGELTSMRKENESLKREISSRIAAFEELEQAKKNNDAQEVAIIQQQYKHLEKQIIAGSQALEELKESNEKITSLYNTAIRENLELRDYIDRIKKTPASVQGGNQMLALMGQQYQQQSNARETEMQIIPKDHSHVIGQQHEYEIPPGKPKGRSRTYIKVLKEETKEEYDPNAPTTLRMDN